MFSWLLRNIVWLDTPWETVYWSWWLWRIPLPHISQWQFTNRDDHVQFWKDLKLTRAAWISLMPFFASRGYSMYITKGLEFVPDPAGPSPHQDPLYPYARRAFSNDDEITFDCGSLRVWPARDHQGREVIIKLISSQTASNELKILEKLNAKSVRSNPRNHTIPVLEFIYLGDWVFAVMPRWPARIFVHDFETVNEYLNCIERFLEGFDFLHENRIAHADFATINCGINVITNQSCSYLTGWQRPEEVRYAIYDFGYSHYFPLDTDISKIEVHSLKSWETDPFNPFHLDVWVLGNTLKRYFGHIEEHVPALGVLLNDMCHSEPTSRPTALQAFQRCRAIRELLPADELRTSVSTRGWFGGELLTKEERPTELADNFVPLVGVQGPNGERLDNN